MKSFRATKREQVRATSIHARSEPWSFPSLLRMTTAAVDVVWCRLGRLGALSVICCRIGLY